jgi:hypothetical protein
MSRSFYLFLIALVVLIALALYGRSVSETSSQPSGVPNSTPTVSSTAPPGEVSDEKETSQVSIFLVAIDDNGKSGEKIGCGDSLIPVRRDITPTTAPLQAALEELMSLKSQTYGESGLYNALYQSNLTVERAAIMNGKAEVSLRGTYVLGGTCDTPRFSEQIKETVRQFPRVQAVDILLNGKPIDEALSQK